MHFVLIEPNAPPANIQGHNTSSTSIWVDWDAVPIANQNGIILTYTMTYSSLPGSISQTAVINASSTHLTLKRLKIKNTQTIASLCLHLLRRVTEMRAIQSL